MVLHHEVWQISNVELMLRIFFALVIGGLIGLERELGDHAAGFRTHILVCLGSALIMLLSIYGFSSFAEEPNVQMDPARLAAQVISGIGFLGAGTIMRTGMTVSGLTTAASLWVVAALGLAVGAGFYLGAFLATALVLICLFFLNKLEKTFLRKKTEIEIRVSVRELADSINMLTEKFKHFGAAIEQLSVETTNGQGDESPYQIRFVLKAPKSLKWSAFIAELNSGAEVVHVRSGAHDAKDRNMTLSFGKKTDV